MEKVQSGSAQSLGEYAARDDDSKLTFRKYPLNPDGFRTDFERDFTRILYSRAFRRLRHKTQVFIRPENDHICTRLEHSLYVASIAKTIAKQLQLNIDLVQAIALGHDIGHAPFGHEGERYLHRLGRSHGIAFKHELHSLRIVDAIDSPYKEYEGLDLTFAVRDGIACHNGESFEKELRPDSAKTTDQLEKMDAVGPVPATMEGCVVRFSDKIAYLGRDLEDAREAGIVKGNEIPEVIRTRLGITNREIISVLIRDLVGYSQGKDLLGFSDPIYEALDACRGFNYAKIYSHDRVTHSFPQIEHAMKALFEVFRDLIRISLQISSVKDLEAGEVSSHRVLALFLKEDVRRWAGQLPERLAVDFIAGMTDNYFMQTYKDLFLPKSMV